MIIELEEPSQFKATIDTPGKVIVVDFYTTICPPCRILTLKFKEHYETTEDVIILKVNVDNHLPLANHFNITAVPSLFFYKNGEQKTSLVGPPFPKVQQTINELLAA
jgi:thioredoxin 1